LPEDPKKREKRLKDLGCTEQEYTLYALPAQVQLAEKMRRRGLRVEAGERIEYVITNPSNIKGKLFQKIEDPNYVKAHPNLIEIDYFYYIKLCSNPIDQLLSVAYGIDNYVWDQYKERTGLELKSIKLRSNNLKFL